MYFLTMHFIPMDPALIVQAIQGYEDHLSTEAKKMDAFYSQFVCPNCNGKCHKETTTEIAFSSSDSILAKYILRCNNCQCLFDPHTGILLERGGHIEIEGDFSKSDE